MRAGVLACLIPTLVATASFAEDPSPDSVKGLNLAADFPASTIRAGEEATPSTTPARRRVASR